MTGDLVPELREQLVHLLLTREIEGFLYTEAELLDERRFEAWLDLLTEDVRHWMPMRRNVKFGEQAREHTRERQEETETDFFVGKREDLLRKVNGQWKIARRTIILDQNVLLAKNLTVFF
ncbi:MAG: hypothetical protein HYZ81_07845 [Nitrospinae bacterium]|nr:hypothetical protein [Nitrospinota bacterium]